MRCTVLKWSNVMSSLKPKEMLQNYVIIFLWEVIYVHFYNWDRPLDLVLVVYDLIELIIEASLWNKDYSTWLSTSCELVLFMCGYNASWWHQSSTVGFHKKLRKKDVTIWITSLLGAIFHEPYLQATKRKAYFQNWNIKIFRYRSQNEMYCS